MEEMINEEKGHKKTFLTKMMLFFTVEYILLTRVGETQGMKYSNLLFDYKIYSLYEAWNKRTNSLTPTKNRKARILYIPTSLLNAFEDVYKIDSQREDFNEDEFIFGGSKVFPRSTIDRYRKELLTRANVDYVSNHRLRHAGISNAMHNEVDASALSDMAGHDKEIMYKTYVQTLEESNSVLVEILDKLYVPKF
ncbi:MAG: tyrosine-type recombinase/integrase [Bacilli bacterium]|nr:tyrosine-type recombinase/integrase [Bacilli bacterium]